MYRLDRSKAQEMQISNDAFFYFYTGEEPLDEDNLEEVQEVLAMFPNGFEVDEDWKPVEDSDLIECVFVPFVEDDLDYDEYEELTAYHQEQIKWIDQNHIRLWWFDSRTGTRELKGDFEVLTNKFNLRYFEPGKNSLRFLKHFKKKGC